MEHTKWYIGSVGIGAGHKIVIRDNKDAFYDNTVALLSAHSENAEANARLIAAAPELLAELIKAHNTINRLVEQIHLNDTKQNKIVEKIKWPEIREVERKQAIKAAK